MPTRRRSQPSQRRPRRALVTGGAGFIGSHVVDRLVEAGHRVTVLDNFSTGRRALVHPRARIERYDLRRRGLSAVVAKARPEVVVHLAAQASVPRSVAAPLEDADVNVLGTLRLLDAAARAGTRAFVYISTGGAAYGDTEVIPTPEDHPLRPSSPYGVSKVSGERYVECMGALSGMRAMTLRLANVYGPRQDPSGEAGVISIFAKHLLAGEPCTVYGDGEQTRDFVYVGDVADAVVLAIDEPTAVGAVNVSTGNEVSINTIYDLLAAAVGTTARSSHAAPRPGEQRRSVLSPTRARQVLGWVPKTTLETGLGVTVEYFRRGTRTR
jgi:UDP-glucose 4-epimerase